LDQPPEVKPSPPKRVRGAQHGLSTCLFKRLDLSGIVSAILASPTWRWIVTNFSFFYSKISPFAVQWSWKVIGIYKGHLFRFDFLDQMGGVLWIVRCPRSTMVAETKGNLSRRVISIIVSESLSSAVLRYL
jgi:hypothetical protein